MKMHRILLALLSLSSLAAAPATAPSDALLGPRFESQAAGIALRPPAGARVQRGPVGSNEIVRFTNDDSKWVLKVSRVLLEAGKPLPLSVWKDAQGSEHPGMFELTIDQLKNDVPGAQILRQDVTKLGDQSVGLMAAKFNFGVETNLTQQAVIRVTDGQYYVLGMTTPAPRTGDLEADPNVQKAVETFSRMLDSVELLDQATIQQDRDDRLMRTRTLYANLTEAKLRAMLRPERWLRVVQNGKDIGYMKIVEEVARDLPRKGKADLATGPEGVLVGVRSRMTPQLGVQVDSESWYFCTFDRKTEAFSTISYAIDPKSGKTTSGDLGVSNSRQRPVVVKGGLGEKPDVAYTDEYTLQVTKLAQNVSSEPIVRNLPPFYLPQALVQLLPRLMERREPRTYLFAAWVPDAGEVMYRYVDVGIEQDVTLAGKRLHGVPVKDRVGLEGSVTTHYVSPEGEYLGSINADTGITILATDAATLSRLWPNGNLSRPGAIDGR